MKKLLLSTIILIIGISLLGCMNESTPPNNDKENTDFITIEEATEIALKHANLTRDQVNLIDANMEEENGLEKYDIEFYVDNKEYDYEINGLTGDIIAFDYDIEDYNIKQPSTNSTTNDTTNNNQENSNTTTDDNTSNNGSTNKSTVSITEDKAKEIALKHANLSSDQVTFERIELEVDNNIQKYEVEFRYNNMEYDYEINANDGKIISFEEDQI